MSPHQLEFDLAPLSEVKDSDWYQPSGPPPGVPSLDLDDEPTRPGTPRALAEAGSPPPEASVPPAQLNLFCRGSCDCGGEPPCTHGCVKFEIQRAGAAPPPPKRAPRRRRRKITRELVRCAGCAALVWKRKTDLAQHVAAHSAAEGRSITAEELFVSPRTGRRSK